MNRRFFFLLIAFFVISCTKTATYTDGYHAYIDRKTEKHEFEIMAYNVENLFDHVHDKNKNDWAFTPKNTKGKLEACNKIDNQRYKVECLDSDWTESLVDLKISQIKKALTHKRSHLPDILVLSEIENEKVISKLARELGYKNFYVSDSPDERGVDLAVLLNESERFKFVAKREIVLNDELFKNRPTRNILEVELLIDGKYPLSVFANHWPSLRGPNELRVHAASELAKRIKQILEKNQNHYIVATGDFNTIPGVTPHPIDDLLIKDAGLIDVHYLWEQASLDKNLKSIFPKGSYYYSRDKVWSNLDRIFITKNLIAGDIQVLPQTFQIYAPKFLSNEDGTPKRYNHGVSSAEEAGFSDHYPLLIKFNIR